MCEHAPFLARCLDTIVFGSNNLETIPINVDPSFTGQDNVNVFNVHVAKKFGTKNANC